MSSHFRLLRFAFCVVGAGVGLLLTGAGARAEDSQSSKEVVAMNAMAASNIFESVDVDHLTLESDYSIFMHKDCPPELQKKALQRLWQLLPKAAVQEATAF